MTLQEAAGKLELLQAEVAALRAALGGASGSSSAAAAAAPARAPVAPAEVYLLGGNDQGTAGSSDDESGWLSSVLIYTPSTNTWRQGEGALGLWVLAGTRRPIDAAGPWPLLSGFFCDAVLHRCCCCC